MSLSEGLKFTVLRAAYAPAKPTTLYGDNGIEIRGTFGKALLERVCYDLPTCRKTPCAFPESCVYASVFGNQTPGYHLQLPSWRRFQPCGPDDPVVFLLVVVGPALQHVRLLLRVLKDLEDGLFTTPGAPTVPSSLVDLTCLSTPGFPEGRSIIENGRFHPDRIGIVEGFDLLRRPAMTESVSLGVEFVTPTNLVEANARVTEPSFSQVMRRAVSRIKQAARLPHSFQFDLDLDEARGASCRYQALEQVSVKRTSKAQKFEIWLHGFRGRMVFDDVPGAFLPYMDLARYLNIGQKTSHGLGHFRLLQGP